MLLLLLAAVYFTRPAPRPSPTPAPTPGPGQASGQNANTTPAPASLNPLSATTLTIEPADAQGPLTFTLEPLVDRWTLTQGSSTTLAQTPAVRGALTLLRDALAQPPLATKPQADSPTRLTLRTGTLSRTLLVDTQALGGRTTLLDDASSTAHAGSADLASLFTRRSLLAWADPSAMPEFTPATSSIAISQVGVPTLSLARSGPNQRWAMLSPVPAPIEQSALDQLLGVLRALQIQSPQPLTPALGEQHALSQGRNVATITLLSRLVAGSGTVELNQSLLIGAPADASARSRWVASTAAAPSALNLSPLAGTLDVQAILDFAKAPEALVARAVLRAAPGDIASISLAFDAGAFRELAVVAPHEPATRAVRLLRAGPEHRAALGEDRPPQSTQPIAWVLPAPAADARVLAATSDQATLATALTQLLTDGSPSSMRLLTSSTTLDEVFDFAPVAPVGSTRQAAQAIATFTLRDLGDAALETGCLAMTTSGPPRVLVRVGRVLRVWDASPASPAANIHTLLAREVVPEG